MSDKTTDSELENLLIQVLGDKKQYTKKEVMIGFRVLASEKDWENHPANPLNEESERTSEAYGEASPLNTLVSGKALIEELQSLKEDECQCCGDLDEAIWKECGCHIEGINEGLTIAISKIQKAL